ncbi:MAG: PTS system mannose/fructose/sorbose family transporter subunit IID [Gemmatimonadaceae bacterium]|nr:PTS system mannose/fructose/sorbose family transporter subunit IID [Gemmatimonadaceae bacterium]
MTASVPPLPLRTRLLILARLLTLQGSYNYETMVGNGIAFAMEPALRLLPGGRGGDAYRAAMARESRYFNAHPYMAAMAVGALARAELALEDPGRIERFRTAACGPLGGVGDRLVWAGWLPLCSLLALLCFGLGASPGAVVATFLLLYNAGHVALRVWALDAGWRSGLACGPALGRPVFRNGPAILARAGAVVGGAAIPLVVAGASGARLPGVVVIGAVGAAGAVALAASGGRVPGWRAALLFLLLAAVAALVV